MTERTRRLTHLSIIEKEYPKTKDGVDAIVFTNILMFVSDLDKERFGDKFNDRMKKLKEDAIYNEFVFKELFWDKKNSKYDSELMDFLFNGELKGILY